MYNCLEKEHTCIHGSKISLEMKCEKKAKTTHSNLKAA